MDSSTPLLNWFNRSRENSNKASSNRSVLTMYLFYLHVFLFTVFSFAELLCFYLLFFHLPFFSCDVYSSEAPSCSTPVSFSASFLFPAALLCELFSHMRHLLLWLCCQSQTVSTRHGWSITDSVALQRLLLETLESMWTKPQLDDIYDSESNSLLWLTTTSNVTTFLNQMSCKTALL